MKISKPFLFKQFTVEQHKCALKVNTDAVLLGALAETKSSAKVLEIGTGTGVISLMLAQRFPDAIIHGVEIEKNAFDQTYNNFAASPWNERLSAFFSPFQKFSEKADASYDLIVCNPPYYEGHLKTQHLERNIALHSDALSFIELGDGIINTLSQQGELYVILPARQMGILDGILSKKGLYPMMRVEIFDKPDSPVLRIVQSYSFTFNRSILQKKITIKNPDETYSLDYADLLKDFLLIF